MTSLMNTYNRMPVTFTKGQGAWLYDTEGKAYLDFVSGVAVNSLGHSHPAIIETLKSQSENLLHVSNLYYTEPQIELAKRLTTLAQMKSVFFSNSGSEAVETALKIARKYGKSVSAYKTKIIHMAGSFHGRTMGSLTVTSNVSYQAPFLPLVADTEDCPINDIAALKRIMSSEVCAVILEPIQGESGVTTLHTDFIQAARDLCTTHQALLIMDEVQCGIGRTGTLFYHQQLKIKPDILCLAKGLGGGFPIGATLVNHKADILMPGDHGSTFGGNPMACAVANTVLQHISEDSFLESINDRAESLLKKIRALNHRKIHAITGKGLMLGLHLKEASGPIIQNALKENLLLIAAGKNTIRLLPPLNVTEDEIDLMIRKLVVALV